MILALDTYYFEQKAKTVCLEFNRWNENKNYKVKTEIIDNIEEYIPSDARLQRVPTPFLQQNKAFLTRHFK